MSQSIKEVPRDDFDFEFMHKLKSYCPEREMGHVYFLIRKIKGYDRIVYVGSTTNMRHRIMSHVREGVKKFDEVRHLRVQGKDRLRIEAAFIKLYNPEYNGNIPTRFVGCPKKFLIEQGFFSPNEYKYESSNSSLV